MSPEQILQPRLELTERLEPAMVARGVLQRFFVSPTQRMEPLAPAEIRGAWQRLAAQIRQERAPELLSLYVHIPFCAHRCRYCVYYSVEPSAPDQVDAYLQRLHAEIDHYADALSGVGFSNCYIGGGTPTLLDPGPLEALLTHLDRAFARKRGGEWSFECNPATVTEAKAALFQAHGFNRVSFGVQSLDPEVLSGVGRGYQTRNQVVETFRIMKQHELWINVDLMHGLPRQTTSSMLQSLRAVLALEPNQVTIYALSPYTPSGVKKQRLEPHSRLREEIDAIGSPLGYRTFVGTTFISLAQQTESLPEAPARPLPEPNNLLTAEHMRYDTRHNYDDTTVEPFSLLGLGPTARSYVYGQLRYANDRLPVQTPWSSELVQAAGHDVTMEDERRRFVVYGLEKLDGVEVREYESRFGASLIDHFGEALLCGVELGLLDQADGRIRMRGSDPRARYATALLFVDDQTIQSALDEPPLQGDGTDTPPKATPASSSPAEDEYALALRAGGREVIVNLANHRPGRRSFHHKGRFAFYLPSTLPEGTCDTGNQQARLLAMFTRVFDRVVSETSPEDLEQLREGLLRGLTR